MSTGKGGDDYTTECLLDNAYFKDCYRLVVVHLGKHKTLDADLGQIDAKLMPDITTQKLD